MSRTKNMTVGSPLKLIVLFAVPLMIGNTFLQFSTMLESSIVGRFAGVNGTAAIGATAGMYNVILGFTQGLAAGLPILIAHRYGAGDEDGVKKSICANLTVCAGIALLFTALLLPAWRPILSAFHTPAEIARDAYVYMMLMSAGLLFTMLHYLIFNIVRSMGDSKTPLIFQVVTCVIEVGLSYLFIVVFRLGVIGIPIAQMIARLLGTAAFWLYMVRIARHPLMQLRREDWRLDGGEIREHLKSGVSSGCIFAVACCGVVVLQPELNKLGAEALTGYTVTTQISGVLTQLINAFGLTMTTYISQNYGAGKYHRIRSGIRRCALLTGALSIGLSALGIFGCRLMVGLFMGAGEGEFFRYAQINMNFMAGAYLFLSWICIFRAALQSLGSRVIPILSSGMDVLMRIIAVLFMVGPLGYTALCASQMMAWIGNAVPLVLVYLVLMKRLRRERRDDFTEKPASPNNAARKGKPAPKPVIG